jgi:hypothetical protein
MSTNHQTEAPDLIVYDAANNAFMLVEVKASQKIDHAAQEEMLQDIRRGRDLRSVEFLGLVDPDSTRILRLHNGEVKNTLLTLSTPELLAHYDPEYGRRQIYGHYMEVLVEAWLRDLAFRWKHQAPPGLAALEQAGVAQRLRDGFTESSTSARSSFSEA